MQKPALAKGSALHIGATSCWKLYSCLASSKQEVSVRASTG